MYANRPRVTMAERLACWLETPTGTPCLFAGLDVSAAAEPNEGCIRTKERCIVEDYGLMV
jgi:hypothetical protein